MKRLILIISTVFLLASCAEDELSKAIDDGTFEAISSDQPFDDVDPAYQFDYWELIWKDNQGNEFVHFKSGLKCRELDLRHNCLKDFYSLDSSGAGFGINKKGGHYFIRTNEKGYNKSWTSLSDLDDFLGHIDSQGDALLKSAASGFYFEKEEEALSGVKEISDGYQIIALKTISICSPLRIDKFLIQIDKTGDLSVLEQQKYLEEKSSCMED